MIDSHCHIHYLDQDIDSVLERSASAGIKRMLNVAVVEKEWQDNITLGLNPMVDVGLGVHPCDIQEARLGWQERLKKAAAESCVVAIGETGLDYYHDTSFKKEQIEAFEDHIAIAIALDKPIIVHMRQATDDTMKVLKKYAGKVKGVIHCFSEDWACAKQMIEYGMMISFSGIVTFKNAKAIQEAAQNIPLEWILVETDAPYLAPMPYRGKTNYPEYVQYVIEHIAKMRDMSVEEITHITSQNYAGWVAP